MSAEGRALGRSVSGWYAMSVPANIFDPSLYERVRRPVMEAHHLPPWCYTSEAFYQREVDTIFLKEWNLLGREDRLTFPGDYFTANIAGVPLFVIRNTDGELRAFANTCTHRGSRLLQDEGRCRSVVQCPYHAWAFDFDGALVATPGMERAKGFEPGRYGLRAIKLETWDGFVFINFDPESRPLLEYLGALPDSLGSYDFADMVTVRRKEYDLACNWKLFIENAMEEYHTPTVHKASVGKQSSEIEEGDGEWDAAFLKSDKTIAILPGETAVFPHIESLDERARSGTNFVHVKPATMLGCTQDCMWWLEQHPMGPARTKLTVGSCFPRSTVERPDFEQEVEKYYYRWDKSIPEDNWISEVQQQGLSSPLSRTSRISHHEVLVHKIANWVLDRVLDG